LKSLENTSSFAEVLRQLRLNSGKSQAEFAKIVGVSQRTWSAYESGETRPKLALIIALEAQGYSIPGFPSPFKEAIDSGKISREALEFKSNPENWGKLGLSPDADIDVVAKALTSSWNEHKASVEQAKALEKYRLPLLRQKVSCGPGEDWEQDDNIEKYLDINTLIPQLGIGRLVAFRARGSSMLGAGIQGGDYVLFDASADELFTDGIYVFMLDGDVFCKRLEFDDLTKIIKIFSVRVVDLEKAELAKTVNTADPDFADRFRIFGRVKTCIRPVE
jgi:transcriptional regulator with XRE-family HTH domain